jgi:periplasmic divalent cation tolerance protein
MLRATEARMVLVTCRNLAEGRKIAKALVEERLAACVNVVSTPVESVYRWKDKIESAEEILLVIKTTARRLRGLEKQIANLHSYDVPEFLVLAVESGSKKYLAWLTENA